MVTVAFSELRQNLTQVAEKVANEGEEVVVFKRSKPLFKIVPLDYEGPVTVEYDAAQERGGAKPTCGTGKPKRDVGTMWHPKITWKEIREMLAENEDYQEYLDIVANMPKHPNKWDFVFTTFIIAFLLFQTSCMDKGCL